MAILVPPPLSLHTGRRAVGLRYGRLWRPVEPPGCRSLLRETLEGRLEASTRSPSMLGKARLSSPVRAARRTRRRRHDERSRASRQVFCTTISLARALRQERGRQAASHTYHGRLQREREGGADARAHHTLAAWPSKQSSRLPKPCAKPVRLSRATPLREHRGSAHRRVPRVPRAPTAVRSTCPYTAAGATGSALARAAHLCAWSLLCAVFAAAAYQGSEFASTKPSATAWGGVIGLAAFCAWLAVDEDEAASEEDVEDEESEEEQEVGQKAAKTSAGKLD